MQRSKVSITASFALALVAAGCSGQSGGGPDMMTGTGGQDMAVAAPVDMTQLPPPPDLEPAPWPKGPYGINNPGVMDPDKQAALFVGKPMFDFSGSGYRLSPAVDDPTGLQPETIKLSEVLASRPMCNCLMVTLSAEWCEPCQEEQGQLINGVNSDPTFCVMGVLVQDFNQNNPNDPLPSDVATWTYNWNENFPVIAADALTHHYLPEPFSLPTAVVINAVTKKVLDVSSGISADPSQTIYAYARGICDAQ